MTGALKFLIKEITIFRPTIPNPSPPITPHKSTGHWEDQARGNPREKKRPFFSLKMKYTAISRLSWKIFLKMMRFDDDIQNNNSNEVFFFVDEV